MSAVASSNTPQLKAPIFSFTVQNQAEEWKLFFTRAVGFPKALDIDPKREYQSKKGWRQIKMMFEGGRPPSLTDPAGQQNNHYRRLVYPHAGPEYQSKHYHDEILNNL